MPRAIKWMDVASNGSTKPEARPTERQLCFQNSRALPGGEGDDSRIVEGDPAQAAHQRRFRSGVAAELARVHIALPHAMLQGYLPDPARGLCRGAREGKQRLLAACLGHDGAVARQIIGPIHGSDTQRLADQESLETRAVDEEVTFNLAPIGKPHAVDEAVVSLLHLRHFALDALAGRALRRRRADSELPTRHPHAARSLRRR